MLIQFNNILDVVKFINYEINLIHLKSISTEDKSVVIQPNSVQFNNRFKFAKFINYENFNFSYKQLYRSQ